jgi:glycosyltransferase involved in cell wall biosynthesis
VIPCRILYLIGELHTGGAERQLYYLLRAMDRKRYKPAVAVWNYREHDVHVAQIRALNVPLYTFPPHFSSPQKLVAFRRLIRQLQPEVVHSYSFYTNFAVQWGALASAAVRVGSIRSDFVWAMGECGPVVGRLSARWPSTQICNSLAAAQSAQSLRSPFVPQHLSVVRNGIDLERFASLPLARTKPFGILGIGYLLPVKRWECLITAASKLKKRDLHFFVRIAGDGPLLSTLKAQAAELGVADRIQFLGHVDDVANLLSEAALVVHTAESEGCPNSVMEAMACARAVVATAAGDISWLVEHGTTGFVVPQGDNDGIVEHVARLIADPGLCCRMGTAGRIKAEKEFGLDQLVDRTFAAYRSAGWNDEQLRKC